MRISTERLALVAADAFAAVSAVGGGVALVAGLEGDRFPRGMLEGTPFTSYVLPGLILALVVGGSATVATTATLVSAGVGATASTVAGAIMFGWIIGEALILNQPSVPSPTEILYGVVGLLMVGLGLAGRRQKEARYERASGPKG